MVNNPGGVLLTRNEFRLQCLERDGYKCVICGNINELSTHHILERRIFGDPQEYGGYFLDNGATLCEDCHILAEKTLIWCDELRQACKITRVILPSHLYDDFEYDKWGNIILTNGNRLRGELFYDESVQKILKDVIHLFVPYVKHPRTHHLPWSRPNKDDKSITDLGYLSNTEVVVTVKLDGEQSNMYSDYIHCRSLDPVVGVDRAMVKSIWGRIRGDIPPDWRVCGENVYAKHSIKYDNLEDWFYMFAIWNEKNECLNWDDTKDWAELLGVKLVPELYRGPWNEELIKSLYQPTYQGCEMEGYVVRATKSFTYREFKYLTAKFVRDGHIQTSRHWRHQALIPNELRQRKNA